MNLHRKLIVSRQKVGASTKDFGLMDKKGRRFGYKWEIWEEKTEPFVEDPERPGQAFRRFEFDAPSHFRVSYYMTLDGKRFCAQPREIYHPNVKRALHTMHTRMSEAGRRLVNRSNAQPTNDLTI